jgi:hypothetical protein
MQRSLHAVRAETNRPSAESLAARLHQDKTGLIGIYRWHLAEQGMVEHDPHSTGCAGELALGTAGNSLRGPTAKEVMNKQWGTRRRLGGRNRR